MINDKVICFGKFRAEIREKEINDIKICFFSIYEKSSQKYDRLVFSFISGTLVYYNKDDKKYIPSILKHFDDIENIKYLGD